MVRAAADDYILDGELTVEGVTRPASSALHLCVFGADAYGGTRSGFSASAAINRQDFGVDLDTRFDAVRTVVADMIDVNLEIAAVLRQS